jgi:hypothetical protein
MNLNAQTFMIHPDMDTLITGNLGTEIYLYSNSLVDAGGNQATDSVIVTLKEIYTIKDMILSHVPTTSGGSILQSGGMIYLSFSSGSTQYYPASYLNLNMPNSNPVSGMNVFWGIENSNTGMDWVLADSSSTFVSIDSLGVGYDVYLDSLGYGWINCDKFYNVQPQTDVVINPSVTGEHNESVDLAVYLAFPSINSCMNVYNTTVQQTVTAYNIPVGMQAAAIILGTGRVTKKSYFGIAMFTVTAGQPVSVSVTQTNEADIISALQVL